MCDSFLTTGRISLKFLWEVLLARGHHISSGFLIWPSFQGHRGQSSPSAPPFVNDGTLMLLTSNFMNMYPWVTPTYRPNYSFIWFTVWPPGGFFVQTEIVWLLPYYLADLAQTFMGGTSCDVTSYIRQVFDLTYFSRSQRSKFVKSLIGGKTIQI